MSRRGSTKVPSAKQGYMFKLGESGLKWSKRYVVLQDDRLQYFRPGLTQPVIDVSIAGAVLTNARFFLVGITRPYSFVLQFTGAAPAPSQSHPDRKLSQLVLDGTDLEDTTHWIDVLKRAGVVVQQAQRANVLDVYSRPPIMLSDKADTVEVQMPKIGPFQPLEVDVESLSFKTRGSTLKLGGTYHIDLSLGALRLVREAGFTGTGRLSPTTATKLFAKAMPGTFIPSRAR
eukprot:4513144-Prymnesium_polylepis.1